MAGLRAEQPTRSDVLARLLPSPFSLSLPTLTSSLSILRFYSSSFLLSLSISPRSISPDVLTPGRIIAPRVANGRSIRRRNTKDNEIVRSPSPRQRSCRLINHEVPCRCQATVLDSAINLHGPRCEVEESRVKGSGWSHFESNRDRSTVQPTLQL